MASMSCAKSQRCLRRRRATATTPRPGASRNASRKRKPADVAMLPAMEASVSQADQKPQTAAAAAMTALSSSTRGRLSDRRYAVAGGEIWIALDPAGMPVSMEEKLRGGDRKINGCLIIDTLRQETAERIGAELSQRFPAADVGVFRVLCQLGRGDV